MTGVFNFLCLHTMLLEHPNWATSTKKNAPKYQYATMKELRQYAEQNNLTIAQVILANEVTSSQCRPTANPSSALRSDT
jgi:hypothetical protein